MSDELTNSRSRGDVIPYEPPTLTPLGNVRDLLAGNFGTQPDGDPPDEDQPTQPT
jgi:hypothetical protein